MDWTTNVAVHESASPRLTQDRVLSNLRKGVLDPSLLYGGLRQATLWTALHQSASPAIRDETVIALYNEASNHIALTTRGNVVHTVSLGCGCGGKDVRVMEALRSADRAVIYTPADISLEMVMEAREHASSELRGLQCTPLMCEILSCSVFPGILKSFDPSGAERLILFLGTIHNYWPPEILKSILYPLRSQDRLLISGNLADTADYEGALRKIIQQYDNAPTRNWLMGGLSELNLSDTDGELIFSLEEAEDSQGLKRIEARFHFSRGREVTLFGSTVSFSARSSLRVFYSYRFTPEHLRAFLKSAGLAVAKEWLAPEEGLFLCHRSGN